MNQLVTFLLSYLLLYKYTTLFVIVFTAGILLPFPIGVILIAAGAFANQGYFNPWFVFGMAEVANVLGDVTGYFIMWKWKENPGMQRLLQKFKSMHSVDKFMHRHGGVTIVVSRFSGPAGTLINFLSGIAGVPIGYFIFWDAIGNAINIGLCVTVGYILGTFWENYFGVINDLGLTIFVTEILIVILAILVFKKRKTKKENTDKNIWEGDLEIKP